MSEAGPRVNGPTSPTGKYIDGIDPDDPQYIKNLQRPAEVKEDLQQMENRSRVSVILNSQAFKDELEQVVEEQLRNGPYPASLIALQQITDLLLPQSKGSLGSLARASSVIPINDLRGVESLSFAKGEKLLRCKVASLYRLVDLCGWSHGIHNHISARVNPESEQFLLNPFGLTYSEITASSLVKVDVNGDIVEPGSTHLGVYKTGFSVHSAIHQARPDIKCIVHLHTPSAVAVSALKCGLLAMSQEALICGNVSYHDFHGVAVDADERERLARNLGVHNKILILRNRGVLACGESVEEAFHFTFNVMAACEAQVKAMPVGLDNIVIPSAAAREQTHRVANQGGGGVDSTGRKWKLGELEFEALMRTLDNSGFRTGHVYKMPLVKQEKKERSNSEVEIPPASSSFTYIFDGDYEHSKYASPVKAAMERHKKAYKAGWLTSPNTYKKTEVDEIGTTTPKKITKWVPETDAPNRPGGAIVKIENPNQFAPQGENPREFKEKQKSIKKDYYEERITAGPQSRILEGITWDEAQRAMDGQQSGAGDQLIVVGAASKGIIQRDHQHNAVVYRQYYAANPFENMSEAEIDAYQAEVQRRERGELETSVEEEVQPPVVESPKETRVVHPPPEPEIQEPEVRYTRAYENLDNTPVSSRPRPPQGYSAHEEVMLAQLAETVVQTVIHDALSVAHQGKGQQTLIGADPLRKHHFLDHLSVGSQIMSDHRNLTTHCTQTQPVDSCKDYSHDKYSEGHSHRPVRTCASNLNRKNQTYGRGHEESTCTAAELICLEAEIFGLHSQKHENLRQNNSQYVEGATYFSCHMSTMKGFAKEIDRWGSNEEILTAIVPESCCQYCQASSCSSEQQGTSVCSFDCPENPSMQCPENMSSKTHPPVTVEQQEASGDTSSEAKTTSQRFVHFTPDSRIILPQSRLEQDSFKCFPSQVCDTFVNFKNPKRRQQMTALTTGDKVAVSSHGEAVRDAALTTRAGAAKYKNLLVIDGGLEVTCLPQFHSLSQEICFKSLVQEQGKCQLTSLNTSPFGDRMLQLKSIDNFRDGMESVTLLVGLPNSIGGCKKNPIDNVLLLEKKKSDIFGLSKNVLDSCTLIKHGGFMTMSRDNSFHPPEITVYPVFRTGLPPGQDSRNVQRTSEIERRPRYETVQRSPNTASRTPGRDGAREFTDSESTASKQKWTPRQRHQRRKLDVSLDESMSVISEGTRRDERRLLERSFGRQGQQDMDPEELNSLRCEEALRKAREEKRARRNEEARRIYEMRKGDPNFIGTYLPDVTKKDMSNNRTHGYEYNRNERDNEMSRTDNNYRTYEDAVRNEANLRNSAYYTSNERARKNEVGDEKENRGNQENKFHGIESRPGFGRESKKYELSGDNAEIFNVGSADIRKFGTDDSNIDHFSSVSNKTESSDKVIKELKDKIEDRKSRVLEKTPDVETDKLLVAEKSADVESSKLPVRMGVSLSQVDSVTAPTQVRQQPGGYSKDKADVRSNDNLSVISDDTVLEERGENEGRSRRQDERDREGSGRDRARSGDRRRGRQDEERWDRDRFRRRSVDSQRRGGRRDEDDDRDREREQRDKEGMDGGHYQGRHGERERRGRHDEDDKEMNRDRKRGRSGERRRGRRDEEEEMDRNRYRGRSGDRERRRGQQYEEEEETDRDRYRGRSGERRRRRDEEEEEMDRDRYRGRSGERRRRRRDEEEEEVDRDRYRGRSGERRRRRRDEEEEEMDRDRYRGRSGDRERRRGQQDDEEEEMDRDRYRGRSGERRRRRQDEEEEEVDRDRYRGRSGERRRRRDEEEEEMDRDRYRGRSGERERRGRRDNEEGNVSDRQRGKSAERERRRERQGYKESEVAIEETERRREKQGYKESEVAIEETERRREKQGYKENEVAKEETERKREKQGYEGEGEVGDQHSGMNEDLFRQRGRRDEDRVKSNDERRRMRDGQLDKSVDDNKSVDISVDSNQILKLDDSLTAKVEYQTETTDNKKAEKEMQQVHDKNKRNKEYTHSKNEDKNRSSRKPIDRDDLSGLTSSLAKSDSKEETKGMGPGPSDYKPANKANVGNVRESLSKVGPERGGVGLPFDDTMKSSIRVETTQDKGQWKPKEAKLDDILESKKLVRSSKISALGQADTSRAGSKHSRTSASSSPHVIGGPPSQSNHIGGPPSQTDHIGGQTVLNTNLPVTEPLEAIQPQGNKGGDLPQASQKVSAVIVTHLDEGFGSAPHSPVKKDKKAIGDRYGADKSRIHKDEKAKEPANYYETAYVTPETVKTSTDKLSVKYNKYSKDLVKDRRLDSTGDRRRDKDREIPEISLKDNIGYTQKFTEREIPEISLKDNIGYTQKFTEKEIPEISLKDNIGYTQKLTQREIPEIQQMKDEIENRQRYRDKEIPEISSTKDKTERGHRYRDKESPLDKTKDRLRYTKREIPEMQSAYPDLVESVEDKISKNTKGAILQQASQKNSAVIITNLDEGFDSVAHVRDKTKKVVGDCHGTDKNKIYEDEKNKEPVNDYETAYITPETGKTDLGLLKLERDKISARYNKYDKDMGKDRQERRFDSTQERHGIKDLGISEISLTKDNIDNKQRYIEKETPVILLNDKNDKKQYRDSEVPEMASTKCKDDSYRDVEIPEMSPTKGKDDRYWDVEIPEMSPTKGKDDRYRGVEIPEMSATKGKDDRYRGVEIPEMSPTKGKDDRYRDVEIPEMSPTKGKAKHGHRYRDKEGQVDKANVRQRYADKEIPEMQSAYPDVVESVEDKLSIDTKSGILQQASQKSSAVIITNLDEGFNSMPLFSDNDKKVVGERRGTHKNRAHKDKAVKSENDYETAYITPETVKTNLGVLKTSADKISANYNKNIKDGGKDRQERRHDSGQDSRRGKDPEIPGISLTKGKDDRYRNVAIPEMSSMKDKTEHMHRNRKTEISETIPVMDNTKNRQRYTNKEIPEMQSAYLDVVESVEDKLSIDTKSGILQQASQKSSAVIITNLDEGFESVAFVRDKNKKTFGDRHGTDKNRTHEGEKAKEPVNDYVTPETVRTDLGVLKSSTDKISARYNKYGQDLGRDFIQKEIPEILSVKVKNENRPRYKDKEVPEMSVPKGTVGEKESHQVLLESPSAKVKTLAIKVLESPVVAKVSARAPRALPEDDACGDEDVDKKNYHETDIDQEIKAGYTKKKGLVDMKKIENRTSELGVQDNETTSGIDNEADVKSHIYKQAIDPEVYKQIKARSLAYKENPLKSHTSKAKTSSDTNKEETKSHVYKEDRGKPIIYEENIPNSDTYKDSKHSYRKQDKTRTNISAEDRDITRTTKNKVEMTDLKSTVHIGDANTLLEDVIKGTDRKIQKKTKSDVDALRSKLPEDKSLVCESFLSTDKAPSTFLQNKPPAEVTSSKAPDVITVPAAVCITRPAVVDITRPAIVDITKPATVDITRPPKVDISRSATVDITKPTAVDITSPAKVDVTTPAKVDISKPSKVDVAKATEIDITGPAAVNITKPSRVDVIRPAKVDITKPSKVDVSKPTEVDITRPAKVDMAMPTAIDYKRPTAFDASRPAAVGTMSVAVDSSPDSYFTDDQTHYVHQIDGTAPSKKIVTDVINKIPESSKQKNRKDDRTKFVKRADPRDSDSSEDESSENRNRGRLSKIANEKASKLGRESGKLYPASRDEGKPIDVSNLRGAAVGEKKAVDNRSNLSDRPTDVALNSTLSRRGEVGKQYPASGDGKLPGVNMVSVGGDAGIDDNRFLKKELSVELLASEAAAKAENRNSKQLSPRNEQRDSSPEKPSIRKDTNEVKRPNQNVRTRSAGRVPEASIGPGREAIRSYPIRRDVRSFSPEDVFHNENQQHKDSRTRPPKLVARTNQARTEATTAHPARRNDRVVSAADISNRGARKPIQDSRTRSSQLSPEPPKNRSWRSASEAYVPKEDTFHDEMPKASLQEPDSSYSKHFTDTEDNTFDDHELSEVVVRPQEKQKYAGFVKRTGRGGRKSLPLRGVSLEGEDMDIDQPQDGRLDEMKVEHTKDDVNKSASQKDEASEGVIRDHFSTVVHENPIEVTVDTDEKPPQPSPKKGIFSFFGCVSGKSADFARMLDRSKKKRPTAYYEEGEKRKIKKLSKEKEKEEKKVLYFEKTEEASESVDDSFISDDTFKTSDDESPEATHDSPSPVPVVEEQPLQSYTSVRYPNRPPPFQPPKPLSTFIDPSEALETIGDSASDEDEGSPFSGRKKRLSGDDSSLGGQFQTFMSFGKSNIGPSVARPSVSSFGKSNIGPSVARPSVSSFGYSTSPGADSKEHVREAEVTEVQSMEITQVSMTHRSVQNNELQKDGKSGDSVNVQLRSKPSDQVSKRTSQSSVRRSAASQRVSAEARLSDFISNLPPPSFDPDAPSGYDASFPPPPEKLDTSSSSSML